jgi:methylenetetrahydrofolate/methylenetetrahydromethanopterin dehydrogenase (NADP+)
VDKRKILIQIDSDPQPSVFDRVVAIDSGADEVFSYGSVTPEHVRDIVHGAIFTRGPKELRNTAIFIGGSDAGAGERLLDEVRKHMLPQFGLRVSALLDSNGANTTAAAAVHAASRHQSLNGRTALVLGGTGPVGQRASRLLAGEGARVRVASRQLPRAEAVCQGILAKIPTAFLEPVATASEAQSKAAAEGCELIIAAGAAGVVLLPKSAWQESKSLRVAIDLNAVPPLGIEGLEVADKAVERNGVVCYGAIGVGGIKMKIHKAAIAKLFDKNDQIMDAEEVYALARDLS